MGLGVLNDHKLSHVPGTATLEDLDPLASAARGHNVKKAKDGTILVPQPSDDPKDPLNWPLWRRDLICGILCILSLIASTLSPLLAANTLTLTLYFRKPFTDIALLTGYHLLGVGLAGFIFVASGRIWGKRHLYIGGTILIVISSVWGGASGHNYNSLMAARFFQGVALAPFEALVNASVGDLYFVHERGKRMALSNLSLFGGAFFTPVIVGKMTHTMGWQWTFYFIAIFSAALLPLVIFFCPETAYTRDSSYNTDTSWARMGENSDSQEWKVSPSLEEQNPTSFDKPMDTDTYQHNHEAGSAPHNTIPAYSWRSREALMPFNGRKTDESFFKLVLRPFPLFFHPGILWACLIQGAIIGWTVLIGIVLAAIMLGPPLFFNEVETGYMYTGAFIGAVLGFALAGLMSDWSARWLTRRNGGIYEPEFRMVIVIPMLIIGCAGLYGFGITADDTRKFGWFWPDFFFALEVMSMVLGAVASALYIVDAHRDLAVEGFTCLLIFKNIFSFGLTFSGLDWLVKAGIKPVFMWISSVQVVICLLTILMYIFGKKNRSFFARHDILQICRLR
ncbi:hypothetical protein CLAFUW4_10172 [Fulvia fulva]|uniref:Major facilitator superfamily (MFS) profile domain-containing protein n=1 Tax=Passalora fulva TaxID=5499 RepID=A0A9Q8LEI8_PASFU|nr:uncharacterized protein CLAFUR5_04785 [Fulvia fulva]KAK4615484.1 hypothetical protein CLAFUR4_10176 [Fulvia fulva]KAK4616605.1 hypothetical protein CLAFUR0_10174 [Fulvia fulva]UJO15956.1 hypothetical protein CLAFUR5_04785 [Fulvia fulva]WPV19525.1 hypothetical protein CLAFUW4_10172 [Fulvia fulva]WPV33726.1 hypothetical protein CLAFUW7_10172 [Fulvia fulva]